LFLWSNQHQRPDLYALARLRCWTILRKRELEGGVREA
jgi:hypothetical protein